MNRKVTTTARNREAHGVWGAHGSALAQHAARDTGSHRNSAIVTSMTSRTGPGGTTQTAAVMQSSHRQSTHGTAHPASALAAPSPAPSPAPDPVHTAPSPAMAGLKAAASQAQSAASAGASPDLMPHSCFCASASSPRRYAAPLVTPHDVLHWVHCMALYLLQLSLLLSASLWEQICSNSTCIAGKTTTAAGQARHQVEYVSRPLHPVSPSVCVPPRALCRCTCICIHLCA